MLHIYYHQHACLFVCLSLLSATVSQTSVNDSGRKGNTVYRATLEFKSSGCAVNNNLNYDSIKFVSFSQSYPKII